MDTTNLLPDPVELPLPCFPHAATRLLGMISNAKVSLDDCVAVLRNDVGLSTNLLRMANSAAFATSRQIESLEHAALMLGRDRLRDLVVATAYVRAIPTALPGYGINGSQFWAHCAAVGIYSEAVGRALGARNASDLFSAGLLHDCGKLLGSGALDDDQPIPSYPGGLGIPADAPVHLRHTWAGVQLIRAWELPPLFAVVAQHHHHPTALRSGRERMVASIVHIANLSAHLNGFSSHAEPTHRQLDDDAIDDLGLTSAIMRQIANDSRENIDQLANMFGL